LIEAALQLKRMFTTAVSMLGCGGWTCPVDRSGSSAKAYVYNCRFNVGMWRMDMSC